MRTINYHLDNSITLEIYQDGEHLKMEFCDNTEPMPNIITAKMDFEDLSEFIADLQQIQKQLVGSLSDLEI